MNPNQRSEFAADRDLRSPSSWERLIFQVSRDVRLWICLLLLFAVYRMILLFVFRGELGDDWGLADLWVSVCRGARYDIISATYLMLPSLLIGGIFTVCNSTRAARRFHSIWIWVLAIVVALFAVVNVGFIREYKEQFNQWIFGMITDDRIAILKTIWKDGSLICALAAWLPLTAVLVFVFRRLARKTGAIAQKVSGIHKGLFRGILVLCFFACLTFSIRGTFGTRPLQQKDAAVTGNTFINAVIPNYFMSLKFAIDDYLKQYDSSKLPPTLQNGGIRAALAEVYGEKSRHEQNLDKLLEQVSPGNQRGKRPKHIFLIVMESGDMWPLLPQYQELGLMPETRRLADHGVLFSRFLSTGQGTIGSLCAIMSGLPDLRLGQNHQRLSRQAFPTALSTAFKKLGYHTRFFYGGYISWQRIGSYALDQGFDEVHGGGDMVKSGEVLGEWGAPDGEIFDYISNHTDSEKPTLNLIMTTSYHPPFSLDVEKLGCAITAIPDSLKARYDGSVTLRQFSHLRYADRELGRFVKTFEQKNPDTLFAITGDHWSRRFLNQHPSLYESSAVPLVLYGPQVLGNMTGEQTTPGTHIDITPTLVGLASDKGFIYHSFGKDLLDPDTQNTRKFALGRRILISPTMLAPIDNPRIAVQIDGKPAKKQDLEITTEAARWANAWLGISWWRLMRGADLPSQ